MKHKNIPTALVASVVLAFTSVAAQAQTVYANIVRKAGDVVSLQVAPAQRFTFADETSGNGVYGVYSGPYVNFSEKNIYKCEALAASLPETVAGGACHDGHYYQFVAGGYAVYDLTTGASIKSATTLTNGAGISFSSVDFASAASPVAYATASSADGSSQTVKVIDIENDAIVDTYTFDNHTGGSVAAWNFDDQTFWIIDYASTQGDAPYKVQQYRISTTDERHYEAVGAAVTLDKSASMSGKLGDCKYLNGHIYFLAGNNIEDYDVASGKVVATLPVTSTSACNGLAIVPQERRFVVTGAGQWTNVAVAPFFYEKNTDQKQVVSITKVDGSTFSSNVDNLDALYYSTEQATTADGDLTYEGAPVYFGESYYFNRKKLSAAPDMSGAAATQTLNGTTYKLSTNGTITFGDYSIKTGLTGTSKFLIDQDSRKFVVTSSGGTFDIVFDGTFTYSDEAQGNIDIDSLTLAMANWNWQTISGETKYGKASFSSLFNSAQTISVVKYPESEMASSLVHKPNSQANGTDKLAADAGATVAINGSYFDMTTLEPVTALWYGGAMQSEGGNSPRCTGMVAFKDGKIDFNKYGYNTTSQEELADWQSRYDAFVVSGHLLRLGGVEQSPFAADSQAFDGVNPRSMIGVTADRTIYMVVVDGRQSGTADGLTIPQMAALARYLGLVDAINLDGGGSSTLWVKGKGVINTPSGGSVRKVPNIIIAK